MKITAVFTYLFGKETPRKRYGLHGQGQMCPVLKAERKQSNMLQKMMCQDAVEDNDDKASGQSLIRLKLHHAAPGKKFRWPHVAAKAEKDAAYQVSISTIGS